MDLNIGRVRIDMTFQLASTVKPPTNETESAGTLQTVRVSNASLPVWEDVNVKIKGDRFSWFYLAINFIINRYFKSSLTPSLVAHEIRHILNDTVFPGLDLNL